MTDESVSLPVRKVQSLAETIRNNVERVIIGKRDIVDLLLVALLSDG
jgi:MoxR-like ATPase